MKYTENTPAEHSNSQLSISDLTMIALFTAVMAVCSWICIPAAVPFTLQTLGVFLTCGLLGGRRGTITVIIYLLLGAIGIPVFSGFTGGIGHLLGPTGGYMIGFLFTALIIWLAEYFPLRSLPGRDISGRDTDTHNSLKQHIRCSDTVLIFSMILGLIVCYTFGTAWFMTVYTRTSGSIGLMTALGWCVFPYVIPDAVKIIIAMLLCRRLRPAIKI